MKTVILENKYIAVHIQPSLGGKMVDIVDVQTGLSFLLKKDPEDLKAMDSFDALWTGGYDEMFPNDAPWYDEMLDIQYEDHGLLWNIEGVCENAEEEGATGMVVRGTSQNGMVSMKKTIFLQHNASIIRYHLEVENISGKALPYVHKLHPAFGVEAETEIVIPGKEVYCETEYNVPQSAQEYYDWSMMPLEQGGYKDMSKLSAYGLADVAFQTIKLEEPWFAVWHHNHHRKITFSFSKEQFPYLTLFASGGGFQGIRTAILEPSTALTSDWQKEKEEGRVRILGAGETYNCAIEIRTERDI